MGNLAFLGIALALSLLGFGVLWMRTRTPRSVEAHIREFARELDALAPSSDEPVEPRHGRQRRGRRSG